jgi:PelA/Pel-15E family pectate lyase
MLTFFILIVSMIVPQEAVTWSTCLDQKASWYKTEEAVRIADNVLLYQRECGGWPKNIDMAARLSASQAEDLREQKRVDDCTIDNGATYTQMEYLGKVFTATGHSRFKDSFIKAFDYLLAAQYSNGGWPQYYPKLEGYYRHITFNDDAMIGVMTLLRDASQPLADYSFIDAARRQKAADAVRKGVKCILDCQIIVDGKRTVWCAQHDEVTLKPAPARSYEKPSYSGSESVGIVRFLMQIDRPDAQVIEAIESAVRWLERMKISGIRVVRKPDESLPKGYDMVVVDDSSSEPIWARFYELGTGRPIFCGRDGVTKYSLAEIEHERRTGYGWYSKAPLKLLTEDYPNWQKKRSPGRKRPETTPNSLSGRFHPSGVRGTSSSKGEL